MDEGSGEADTLRRRSVEPFLCKPACCVKPDRQNKRLHLVQPAWMIRCLIHRLHQLSRILCKPACCVKPGQHTVSSKPACCVEPDHASVGLSTITTGLAVNSSAFTRLGGQQHPLSRSHRQSLGGAVGGRLHSKIRACDLSFILRLVRRACLAAGRHSPPVHQPDQDLGLLGLLQCPSCSLAFSQASQNVVTDPDPSQTELRPSDSGQARSSNPRGRQGAAVQQHAGKCTGPFGPLTAPQLQPGAGPNT